jgi:hypothetical protein
MCVCERGVLVSVVCEQTGESPWPEIRIGNTHTYKKQNPFSTNLRNQLNNFGGTTN